MEGQRFLMADTDTGGTDFGALLEQNLRQIRTHFNPGEKLEGTVTATDRNSVFVDVKARSDAVIDRVECVDDAGELTVAPGDRVEAFFVGTKDGSLRLTMKMSGSVADASLDDAYENGIPIEGRVLGERKGGFEVNIANRTAFCPFSQIDIFKKEPEAYIGERFSFLITENSEGGRNLVVSRRKLLEQDRARNRETLQRDLHVGDIVPGKVTRIMPFGVFVDLGGAEGLVHISELGWGHTLKPEDVLSAGEEVRVMVRELDWDGDRISLSLKQVAGDPWDKLRDTDEYAEGRRYQGTVTQLAPFGAFVELEPGIEGLVHVSQLGAGKRVHHPQEVLAVGDPVEVSIVAIDLERRRMALSMDDTLGAELNEEGGAAGLAAGGRITGTVDGVKDFGVFIRLPSGENGLLHISQVELRGSTNRFRALYDMFPPGSQVDVIVREIKGNRISLTLPETLEKEADKIDPDDLRDKGGATLGNLGDLFDGLKLS